MPDEVDPLDQVRSALPSDTLHSAVLADIATWIPGAEDIVADLGARVFGLDSGFFYYPLALLSDRLDINTPEGQSFARGLAFGHYHYFALDRLLDDQRIMMPAVLLMPLLHERYLSAMQATAPKIDCTQEFCKLHARYVRAQAYEWNERFTMGPPGPRDLEQLSEKSAPVLLAVQAARGCADELMDRAFLNYSAGLQLMDDLADVRADAKNGLPSIPLRMVLMNNTRDEWPMEGEGIEELHSNLWRSGAANRVLRLAQRYFSMAQRQAIAGTDPYLEGLAARRYQICHNLISGGQL